MQQYDTTLKLLFQRSAATLSRQLAGVAVERWLNVELPRVMMPRVDLLGETAAGELVQFEFQSDNDRKMPYRMAEYYLAIYRQVERHPLQIVIYVGDDPLRMKAELATPAMTHRYQLFDIRTVDSRVLLDSPEMDDNMLAILTRLSDERRAIRQILGSIASREPGERAAALEQFIVLATLRKLEKVVEQEARNMPILVDILDNQVLGREYKRGLEEGRQEGRQEGELAGELALVRRLIEKRFGSIPEWADAKLKSSSSTELEALGLRVLDASSLEELLR